MLIFAFIVVVIGGLGSITGSALAAAVVALVATVLEFLRGGGRRRFLGRDAARGSAARCGPRSGGHRRERRSCVSAPCCAASRPSAAAAVIGIPLPPLFSNPLDRAGNAESARAVLRLWRAGALVRHRLRLYRIALVRTRALFCDRRLRDRDRPGALALGRCRAIGVTLVVALLLPLVLGAVCLRVRDIQFAMVTLAFAQAGSILVMQNPFGLTGGEEGLALGSDCAAGIPRRRREHAQSVLDRARLAGRRPAAIGWWAVNSRPGRVWQAIRENERRVGADRAQSVSLQARRVRALGVSCSRGAGSSTCFWRAARAPTSRPRASRWSARHGRARRRRNAVGAVLGGIVYEYLDFRLVELSNATGLQSLPAFLRVPLSEPLFILGVLFIHPRPLRSRRTRRRAAPAQPCLSRFIRESLACDYHESSLPYVRLFCSAHRYRLLPQPRPIQRPSTSRSSPI